MYETVPQCAPEEIDPTEVDNILIDVAEEFDDASELFDEFHSSHEASSVLPPRTHRVLLG